MTHQSEAFIAPAPQPAFAAPLDMLYEVHGAMDGHFFAAGWADITSQGIAIRSLSGDCTRTAFGDALEAGHDMFAEASDYLKVSTLRVELDAQPVQPGGFQQVAEWHCDATNPPRMGFLLANSALPTLSAHGVVPAEAEMYHAARGTDPAAINQAIVQKLLKVEPLKLGTAHFLTDANIHCSAVNETDSPVEKLRVRLI